MRKRLLLALVFMVCALPAWGDEIDLASAHSFTVAGAKRSKPKPCPDRNYVVDGSALLPDSSTPETIVISGRRATLAANCSLSITKRAGTKRGTQVKATGLRCASVRGRLNLVATIDTSCRVMSGTVKAPRARLKTSFTAKTPLCGDDLTNPCSGGPCDGGAVVTVDTTTDTSGDGACSFQEAVQASNTGVAVDACSAGVAGAINTIAFSIPGGGRHTIPIASVTQVTSPLTIDGSTQPGFAGVPLIHLNGIVEDLLRFTPEAGCSTLKSLMFSNTNAGGLIDGAGALLYGDYNQIVGNYFNTDGVAVIGSFGAGLLFDTSRYNVIGGQTSAARNLFGGQTGVYFQDSSDNLVEGNYFGLQADGVTALNGLPANGSGVQIFNVTSDAARNTVRGNVLTGYLAGINVSHGAHDNTVRGNYIGVAADGSTGRANGIGVLLNGGANNTIGGPNAADRNVISGNASTNVTLQDNAQGGADDNTIEGNYIGPDATGVGFPSPNALFGVRAIEGSTGTVIKGNVIAGNQQGVFIDATSTVTGDSSQNCIAGNAIYGVNNEGGIAAPFANNWWGDASGPRYVGNAVGSGDWITDHVTFVPFLLSPPIGCTP